MKMNHLLVAAAVALVPATASLANPALEAKKAKMKAIEEAKEKADKEKESKENPPAQSDSAHQVLLRLQLLDAGLAFC